MCSLQLVGTLIFIYILKSLSCPYIKRSTSTITLQAGEKKAVNYYAEESCREERNVIELTTWVQPVSVIKDCKTGKCKYPVKHALINQAITVHIYCVCIHLDRKSIKMFSCLKILSLMHVQLDQLRQRPLSIRTST